MCSHYQAVKQREQFLRQFGVEPPAELGKEDVWPLYAAPFIRRVLPTPAREALTGLFGLVPHWAADTKIARHTYNARSETVATKPAFRDAWRRSQHCIVPLTAFYEPDWRSGKAVATRVAGADGQALGVAGLWAAWQSPQGVRQHSFTLLTINADDHPLMRNFHKPGEEKRMLVILPQAQHQDWLEAPAAHSEGFLRPYPADALVAQAG